MVEIRTLAQGDLADVLRVYNQGIARSPYSGELDEETWQSIIAAKFYYKPEEVFIAYEDGRAIGYAHACHGPNAARDAPDPECGSIEALFFDRARPDVGRELVRRVIRYHRDLGAKQVLAWSSFSGYPLYRGIHVGLEPLCLASDDHALRAFQQNGFEFNQHSVQMVLRSSVPVRETEPFVRVQFRVETKRFDRAWDQATWLGLEPYESQALVDGQVAARCVYALMPIISRTQGQVFGCIGSLRTVEQYRRKGLAGMLVSRAVNHMFEMGARVFTVGTQYDNYAAHATYRKYGFTIEAELFALKLSLE